MLTYRNRFRQTHVVWIVPVLADQPLCKTSRKALWPNIF